MEGRKSWAQPLSFHSGDHGKAVRRVTLGGLPAEVESYPVLYGTNARYALGCLFSTEKGTVPVLSSYKSPAPLKWAISHTFESPHTKFTYYHTKITYKY